MSSTATEHSASSRFGIQFINTYTISPNCFRLFDRPLEPYIDNVKFRIGTTAEVFEYSQSEEVSALGVCLRIKARVQQRFKVISARRQIDGY